MIRELVQSILDYKLEESNDSYCKLVKIVFELRKADPMCMFSSDYTYSGLLRNVIAASDDIAVFNPKKYLLDPQSSASPDAGEYTASGYSFISAISDELLSQKNCNFDIVLFGFASLVRILGETRRKDLIEAMIAVVDYWEETIDANTTKDILIKITSGVFTNYSKLVSIEKAKLNKIIEDARNIKYADPYYIQHLIDIAENILKLGF